MLESDGYGRRSLVLFGGGGDLSMRMLLPSLHNLDADGLLPPDLDIVAVARTEESQEAFVARALAACDQRAAPGWSPQARARFAGRLHYIALDATAPASMGRLRERLDGGSQPVFYLAVSPTLYPAICAALAEARLATPDSRLVLEKPIGRDLASSRAVNEAVGAVFSEDRVFRIDHYLGKETVQNLIALRFANTLFEPLWNNLSVDHVQITIAETEGVGERWSYYDAFGALRDMVQNHLLQLLCLVAMEPPSDLDPESVRNEKVKVLRSLRPITRADAAACTVRGRYGPGVVGGRAVPGYAEEHEGEHRAETYVAIEAHIENWRWAGVPFFLRTGKRLAERRTEIVIQFKPVPHSIFAQPDGEGELEANRLVIRLQPEEDMSLLLMNKRPGLQGIQLEALPLSLSFPGEGPQARRRIAYERLILDVLRGASTLFVRRDEVEKAWEWVDGITDAWERLRLEPKPYAAGSWGPPGAYALIERTGRAWRE